MKRSVKAFLSKMCNMALTVVAFCGGITAFGNYAQAYIDPSAVTYIIQAVAGVVIAIGAAIGIYFRRAKKKVQDKFGIDETKEMESDEIIVKSEEKE